MATIDDDLAKAVTEGFRQARIDISNQDKLLTGPNDVEIELANGQKKSGPSWPKIAQLASDANLPAFTTVAAQVRTDAQQVAADKVTTGASKDAAKTSETNSKTSETNSANRAAAALASQNAAKTSETNSASSAASAKADADRAQLANPDNWESAPEPDVHIPFNDSLVMRAGFGPYDRINIGKDYVELNSRSATFTRASTATYIDKSGVMQTAEINEPRFEKEGLLIEGSSTNLVLDSTNSVSDTKFTKTINGEWSTFLIAAASSTYNFVGVTPLVGTFAVGEVYTISVWVTENTCTGPLRLRVLDTTATPQYLDYPSGYTGRLSLTVNVTAAGTKFTPALYVNGFDSSPAGTKVTVGRWQVEKMPFATSYIPTTGAAATRAADVCSIQTSCNFKATNYTLAFNAEIDKVSVTPSRRYFFRSTVYYVWGIEPTGAGFAYLGSTGYQDTKSVMDFDQDKPFIIRADGTKKAFTIFNNQMLKTGGIDPTLPLDTKFSFGADIVGGAALYGHIRNFRIWHRALTDAQLKSLR